MARLRPNATRPTDETFRLFTPHVASHEFVDLGKNLDGTQCQVLYLHRRVPDRAIFTLSHTHQLSGFCKYKYVHVHGKPCGVLFEVFAQKCEVDRCRLGIAASESPGAFEVDFSLENLGLIVFKGQESSVLVLPKTIPNTPLLVLDA